MVRGGEALRHATSSPGAGAGARAPPPRDPPTPLCLMAIFTQGPSPGCRDFFHSGALRARERRWRSAGDMGLSPIVRRPVLSVCVTKVSAGFVTGVRDRDELVEEVAQVP
jgi:hypothetical protein